MLYRASMASKTMTTMRKGFVWLIVLLFAAVIAMLVLPLFGMIFGGGFDPQARASDRITQSNDSNAQTTGDVSYNTDGSFGFAHALGDVDINQCLASTQWGTILVSKQKVVLNKWCAAEVYDAKGLHRMAALVRCDIEEIAKHFTDPAVCISDNTMQRQGDELADKIMAQDQMLASIEEDHDEELRELEQRLAAVEDKPARVVTRPTVTQYGITDEQRAEIAQVFEK